MQGTDTSVDVPHEVTLRNAVTSSFASSGVVGRAYPSTEKFAARAVSPTTSTNTRGLRAIATRITRASVPTGSRGARASCAPRARLPASP